METGSDLFFSSHKVCIDKHASFQKARHHLNLPIWWVWANWKECFLVTLHMWIDPKRLWCMNTWRTEVWTLLSYVSIVLQCYFLLGTMECKLNHNHDCFTGNNQSRNLSWPMRFNILLTFLVNFSTFTRICPLRIIQKHLKPSNIMFDKYINPKI